MREEGGGNYVLRVVPGILYPNGSDGGRALSFGKSALMMLVRPRAGVAGTLMGKACGMRAARPRKKESVGDIVADGERGESRANAGTECWGRGDLGTNAGGK